MLNWQNFPFNKSTGCFEHPDSGLRHFRATNPANPGDVARRSTPTVQQQLSEIESRARREFLATQESMARTARARIDPESVRASMVGQFDHFVRKTDAHWFDGPNPTRPMPPLYTRPRNSKVSPTAKTPIGAIRPDCELVKLTDEQLAIWHSA